MFKRKLILPIILSLALVLAACSPDKGDAPEPDVPADTPPPIGNEIPKDDDLDEPDVEEQEDDTPEDPQDSESVDYENIKLKPEEAFDIFVEKYPDVKVKKVEIDTDYGKYVYKVEGFDSDKEYELKIDPENGDILKDEVESDDDNDNNIAITRADTEKIQAIVDKALKDAGENSKLDEWTLDTDNGKLMIEVEIDREDADDIEHTYDLETGELVEKDD